VNSSAHPKQQRLISGWTNGKPAAKTVIAVFDNFYYLCLFFIKSIEHEKIGDIHFVILSVSFGIGTVCRQVGKSRQVGEATIARIGIERG
jgi:hypothetical protein